MKKLIVIFNLLALFFVLAGCNKKDPNTIYIGATPTPHAEILEFIKPLVEEKGYKLDIKVLNDYVTPNKAVSEGSLDANYFQHIPYLNEYNEENKTELVSVGGVHYEPIGIYTKNRSLNLDDLTTWNNATVIMSNSVTDQLRILQLLENNGLINLVENAQVADSVSENIESNPYNLTFETTLAADALPQTYNNLNANDKTVVAINTNFVLDAISANNGLFPASQRILSETEVEANAYVNVIAVQKGHENDPKIQALIEVLQSDEVKAFIETQYLGAVKASE